MTTQDNPDSLDRDKYPMLYETPVPAEWVGGEFTLPTVTPPSQDEEHDPTTTTG